MSILSSQFRVIKPFKCKRGSKDFYAEPGKVVDVPIKAEAIRLMSTGYVEPLEIPFSNPNAHIPIMPSRFRGKRVGIWLTTSNYYSGGRIHLYQLAWCMADAGAEVFLVTNAHPKWAKDYPQPDFGRIYIVLESNRQAPDDLDLAVTDSKGDLGMGVLRYKAKHPHIPVATMNFETPNWCEKFVPDYAKKLQMSQRNKTVFERAQLLMANSGESAKYLAEWLGKPNAHIEVLYPAVNEFALEKSKDPSIAKRVPMPKRPYAVFSARPVKYKGFDLAVAAVWNLNKPFDLACFGHAPKPVRETKLHKFWHFEGQPDEVKYALLRDATMALGFSRFEGAGMVPMEALASGTPCLVYDLPVLREIYGDKLVYVPWGDEACAKATVAAVYERRAS